MPRVSAVLRELSRLSRDDLHRRLREALPQLTLVERFRLLHELGVYHHSESRSGAGSTLDETAVLRQTLPRLIEEYGIASLLDIPCGDFHWLQHVTLDADYIGADIVAELVSVNQRQHSSATRRFELLDATTDPLPRVDLVLCRDLLIHLSHRDCWKALANFVASGSRYLLTSHFGARTDNPDIISGDFRPINLCRPPFGLPVPIRVIREYSKLGDGEFSDRAMALWELSDVAGCVAMWE